MVVVGMSIFFGSFLSSFGLLVVLLILNFFIFSKIFTGLSMSSYVTFDSISVGMVVLSLVVTIFMVLSGSFEYLDDNSWKNLLLFVLVLFFFLVVTFTVSSFLLFYLFFEFAVVPIFVMIIGVGYSFNRLQAALYMFIYTFLASLPMLLLLMFFFDSSVSFKFFLELMGMSNWFFQYWWFFFVLVFMVKLPLFILHLWLPKAHVDAPLLGSMVLAGVLLKLGGYGFYSVLVYVYSSSFFLSFFLVSFTMVGSVLMGVLCVRQVDMKSTVAYSSVVHMGPVFCSLLSMKYLGVFGSYWMMVSHGLCSACLFYLLDMFYSAMGSRSFFLLRGSSFFLPVFSLFWFTMCVSNMGFPPSFNFFSEIFIFMSLLDFSLFNLFGLFLLGFMSGIYNVFLFSFLNHGKTVAWSLGFNFLKMSDFLVLALSSFYLMFFLFYTMCMS